jgi:hypothetical protein
MPHGHLEDSSVNAFEGLRFVGFSASAATVSASNISIWTCSGKVSNSFRAALTHEMLLVVRIQTMVTNLSPECKSHECGFEIFVSGA